MIELKTFPERTFVHLLTNMMKIALYEKKFKKTLNYQRKLLRLIKNTISQSLFYAVECKVR